jgi:protein-S-isoprenylcysteine O-methyltransferase Ste14
MIKFGNRTAFSVLCIVIPLVHLMGIIEYFWPNFINKHRSVLNKSGILICILLFIFGLAGSVWMKSKVQNAGYVYCRKASGVSALAKTLVYTKNMELCEELAASKRISRR